MKKKKRELIKRILTVYLAIALSFTYIMPSFTYADDRTQSVPTAENVKDTEAQSKNKASEDVDERSVQDSTDDDASGNDIADNEERQTDKKQESAEKQDNSESQNKRNSAQLTSDSDSKNAIAVNAQQTIYAILYKSGELHFQYGDAADSSKGEVTAKYQVVGSYEYYSVPWHGNESSITTVTSDKITLPADLSHLFSDCTNLIKADLNNWDTSSLKIANYMFADCTSLTTLNISNWNVSSLTTAEAMFNGCTSLTTLNISNWDTKSLTNAHWMFAECTSLTTLNISNWNTSSLVVADNMFRNCSSITNLDIGKWDTSSLGSVAFMFSGCSSLIRLDIGNWNMSSVEDMSHMFANCSSLISLDIGNWDTSSVEDIGSIFQRCSSLVSLNLGNWATNSVEGMRSVFSGCSNLVSVNISGWDTSSVTDMAYILKGCIKLQKIILGKNFKFVGKNGYLPTPSTTYFPYTTGKWRNTSGQAFTPEEIPNNVADTYIVDTINYKITFNANGGSGTMADQKVDYNESKQLSGNVFVRNGYTFTGWNTQSNGSGTTYKDKATVKNLSETNGDIITLYAKWQKNTYTISYTLNGGSISGQKTSYDVTTEAFTLPTPIRNGYTFTGWAGTGLSSATKNVTVAKGSTGNRSYTANWSANGYTVSFNYNKPATDGTIGNAGTTSKAVTFDSTYGTLPAPTLNGYTFAGWYTAASNGTKVSDTTKYTTAGNSTLYAHWTLNTYSIGYNLSGGTISGQLTSYNVNTATFTLPVPTRTGYTFTGWTGTGLSGATKSVTVTKRSTGNRSYTANWSANEYIVSYNENGGSGSMSQDTATYGESYTAKANNFSRPGYTFAGWNESADGKGSDWTSWIGKPWTWTYTRSITLYAQWIKNTYSISYNLNGGTISGQKTSYDVTTEAFTLPTPIRNGYTFTGWGGTGLSSKTKSVTVAKGSTGNRSYTANWSANVLTINYHNDDGTGFRYVNSTEYSDVTGKDILFTGRGRYDDDFDAKYGLLNASRIYKKGYHSDKYWYLDKKNGNIKADEDLGLAKVQDAAEIFGKLSDFEKGNVTIDIYASMVPNEYTVKFDGNSETSGNVQNLICTYDKLFNIPENTFKKDNYEFVEWNTEKNGSGQSYKSKESVKNLTDKNGAVITLYAQWKIKTYSLSISHTVSGNMGNRNQDFDFSMTLSDKESGTINAVFIDKSGNQTSKTLSVNNENITFTLSHNESMKFIDIPYGTTYTITEKPVDGYTISHTNEKGTITDNKVATFTSTKSSIVPTSADTNVKEMSLIVGIGLIALIIILKKHKTKER